MNGSVSESGQLPKNEYWPQRGTFDEVKQVMYEGSVIGCVIMLILIILILIIKYHLKEPNNLKFLYQIF